MATDQVAIYRPQTQSAPADYVLSTTQDIQLETVVASFDGTGSSGAFLPALQIVLPSGVVAGTYVDQNTPVTQGGSAAVTFGPFLRGVTSGNAPGKITSIASSDGSVKVTNGTGPAVNLSIQTTTFVNVQKQADQSVSSSTVLQNDTELFFATTTNAVYAFDFWPVYGSPVGGGGPDIKLTLGDSATQSGWILQQGWSTADAITSSALLFGNTSAFTYGTGQLNRVAHLQGTWVSPGGGTFQVQWAQNTSNGNPTIMRAGSLLRYTRLL